MKKKMLWMFLVLLTAGVCHAGQFKVVSDGKAVCPIVVADDANHVVRLAAEELK